MQVTFNTTFNDSQLAITAIININNVNLTDANFADIRRYFSDVADSLSISSDGVKHVFYVDFAHNATISSFNDAMELLAEDLTELA